MAIEQRNGVYAGLRIDDVTVHQAPVSIGAHTYMGFVRGRGCPRSAEARYLSAFRRYQDALATLNAEHPGSAYRRFLDLLPSLRDVATAVLQDSQAGAEMLMPLLPAIGRVAESSASMDHEAEQEFLTDAITAAIPGLDYSTADAIPEDDVYRIMRGLKWFAPLSDAEGAPSTDPPATVPSTTSAT